MSQLALYLLGPPRIELDGEEIHVGRRKMVALLAYLATAGLVPLITNDTYLHLTTGRLILEQGSIPQSDAYSFTALGNRYVTHEWLAAVLYALAEKVGGPQAVVVAGKLVPALLLGVALLAALAASGAPWGLGLPLAVLAVTVARSRILARPELLALVLVLTTLALLLRDRRHAREGRRTRALYALVPLGALWVNLHASFPIGIGLVLVFAAADAADGWLARRDRLVPKKKRRSKHGDRECCGLGKESRYTETPFYVSRALRVIAAAAQLGSARSDTRS